MAVLRKLNQHLKCTLSLIITKVVFVHYDLTRTKGNGWTFSDPNELNHANKRLRSLAWQYLFPTDTLSYDVESKRPISSHISDSSVQRYVKKATKRCGVIKEVTPHTIRHTFATRLLESGTNIRVIQDLLGHASVSTTEIYTHVLHKHGYNLKSPIDDLIS